MCSNVFEGFKVLGMCFSSKTSEHHQIYMKEYHPMVDETKDKPPGKTLFILNIPPYATERSINRVFSVAGPIKSVKLKEKNPTTKALTHGLRCAYVVYENSADLQKALKLKTLEPLSTDKHPVRTGISKWVHDYNKSVTGQEKLFERASEIIETHDRSKTKKDKEKQSTDGDGWTQVTTKDRRPGVQRTERNENRLNEKRKRRETGLDDFYRFQTKERNKNQVAALRKSFDEDKELVKKIKLTRNFKPQS